MMKKRKNVQFIAAAALTAALVTSQFSFATVMGDDTATVQVSSLIPNNVTIDQPVPLSDISLPKSDYGTLSWADGSCVVKMNFPRLTNVTLSSVKHLRQNLSDRVKQKTEVSQKPLIKAGSFWGFFQKKNSTESIQKS